MSRKVRDTYSRLAVVIAATLLVFAAAPAALASPPACVDHSLYDVKQVSENGDFTLIRSGITDPSASTLPGDDATNDNEDHILLWDGIVEDTVPSGQQCGDGSFSKCWLQVGVGMGWVHTSAGGDYNGTKTYEPYTELFGANSTYYMHFFENISISENSSVEGYVAWTGSGNQYEAEIKDSSGTFHILKTGDLYYPAAHVAAHSEVLDWLTNFGTTCPTLTNGSPYQNNGTDYNGNKNSGDELSVIDSSGQHLWSGSPDVYNGGPDKNGNVLYWFHKNSFDWPASFRASGPSTSPP